MAKKRTKKISKTPKSPVKPFNLPLALIAAGLLLVVFSFLIKLHEATKLSFQGNYTNSISTPDKVVPTKVTIPKAGIDLPIYETKIVKGEWQIAKNGASYLSESSGLNQKHSAIIYDHNTAGKFKSLSQLKPNDTIVLTGSDKKTYIYKVIDTKVVKSSDVAVLTTDSSSNLILYTCYGFADLKRFIVKAVPST